MIKHIQCDIFESGADLILHQVNCQGVMGSGVAKQVHKKFPGVYNAYKTLCDMAPNRAQLLGKVQQVRLLTSGKFIANLFAQENYGRGGKCYTDYDALKKCLQTVRNYPMFDKQTIAIPYLMGCDRGGGNWDIVYKMIEDIFSDSDMTVLICEYNGG